MGPVFIIASERSGTNLLRDRLAKSQKEYMGCSPAQLFEHLRFGEFEYGDLSEQQNIEKLVNVAYQLTQIHFSPWDFELDMARVIDYVDQVVGVRGVISVGHALMQLYAESMGYKSYICKDNALYEFAHEIKFIVPDAKFIYLYRDPRDVALSESKRFLMTNSLYQIAKKWRYEQLKSYQALDFLGNRSVFNVSYESFLSNEKTILAQLCEFLGVVYAFEEKAVVDSQATAEWSNVTRTTMSDNFGKYATELSSRQLALIESIVWHPMQRLGYRPVNKAIPRVGRFYKLYDIVKGLLKPRVLIFFNRSKISDELKRRKQRAVFLKDVDRLLIY